MSGSTTYTYTIKVDGANAMSTLVGVSRTAGDTTSAFEKMRSTAMKFGECAFALNNINNGLQSLSDKLDSCITPGVGLNSSLADLSAVTGVTGKGLKEIEGYARDAAKTFGGSAAQGVESYKLILSQLSPEIAKVPKALALMGDHIATTSKTMSGDTKAAAEVLTTAMNQFQVSLADPTKAAGVMGEMMNIMSAAAQTGSAELPQIKAALEQSGMAAKVAGVSFAETNAAIQVLDKAGKKGSEGGIALRNVMSTLAQGRFLPKDVQEELKAAGISINTLSDQSLSLSERLKPLQGVMGDNALISKLFGKENSNAALALLSGIDAMDEYTIAIQGTNSAVNQAGVIMGSHAEKMSRQQAWIDDLKISIFNFTGELMPYVKGVVSFFQGTASVMMGVNAIACLTETAWAQAIWVRTKAIVKGTGALYGNITATLSSLIPLSLYSTVAYISVTATYALSAAMKALSKSIYGIPIIGWIAAGISFVITVFKILWDKCEGFRRGMSAVFEVVKAVFYNIGIVIKAVWDNVIKPYFMFWWDIAKAVAGGIWSALKWCWDGIVSGFGAVGNFFVSLWDDVMSGVSVVGDFFSGVWDWITQTCSGVASFISNAFSQIAEPIKAVFAPVWDFVSGIFNKISEVVGKFFNWIGGLWNKLFPKDKFRDLGEAAETGLAKGSESFRKSQDAKKKQTEAPPVEIPVDVENPVVSQSYKATEKTKPAKIQKEKTETVNLNDVKGSTSYGAIAAKMAPVQISGLSGHDTASVINTPRIPPPAVNPANQFNPEKQEYKADKTDHLRDIALNVRKIAAGITLFAGLTSTGQPADAMPTVSIAAPVNTITSLPQPEPEYKENNTGRSSFAYSPPVQQTTGEQIQIPGISRLPEPQPMVQVPVAVPDLPTVTIPEVRDVPGLTLPGKERQESDVSVSTRQNKKERQSNGTQNHFAKFCDNVVINVPAGTPSESVDYILKELMQKINKGNGI